MPKTNQIYIDDLRDRVKSLEKWREEHDPIMSPERELHEKSEAFLFAHSAHPSQIKDDPQKETRETPTHIGLCPTCGKDMNYVGGLPACPEHGYPAYETHHGLEIEDLKPLPNDNLYNKSHLARAAHLNSEQTELAPAREREDMIFCPECGHKL